MPKYLSPYTPSGPMTGPPSAEHMQAMGRLMDESMKAGKLIATGALKKRDGDGFIVTQTGATCVLDEAPKCEWMLAGGWAILQAKDRADVVEDVKKFLRVAGDGRCEVIELFEPPGM